MKPALPAFLALLLAGSALAPFPGKAQTPPTDTAPAVQLPSVTVTAPKEKENPVFGGNPLFDQTFADLAGGPLIEAIFWRHRFLTRHPQEDAVILTTVRGSRLVSATTVYSLEGKIYASSNALGEKVSVPGLASPDLHRAEGLARAANFISQAPAANSLALPPRAQIWRLRSSGRRSPATTWLCDPPRPPPRE